MCLVVSPSSPLAVATRLFRKFVGYTLSQDMPQDRHSFLETTPCAMRTYGNLEAFMHTSFGPCAARTITKFRGGGGGRPNQGWNHSNDALGLVECWTHCSRLMSRISAPPVKVVCTLFHTWS